MKKWEVYFEMYGHRMKTEVLADSEEHAKNKVKAKLNFHKVVEQKQTLDDVLKEGEDLMNYLFKDKK